MGNRNCPVCGNNSSNILRKINMKIPKEYHLPDSYDVVVCEKCGMVYADTSASMEDFPGKSVYSDISSEEYESYDGVFLFEVAEHLLVPGRGIANIERMLKKNGIFMVSVPDYSLIGEDLTSIPNYFNLEHINYFSETTLDYLMSLHGLERIDQKHFGVDLIQVYRKTEEVKTPGRDTVTEAAVCSYFGHQQERALRIDETVEALKKAGTELVIWGTGSYVMNLFATTSLPQCNIKGFVDNNKLKQGRKMYDYTIFPPECL